MIIINGSTWLTASAVNDQERSDPASSHRFIRIGDKECEFNPQFRLLLHTKLASPHYQPELQAQCTLINFTVTRDGLEEQLLAAVVTMERPDLEQLKVRASTAPSLQHISFPMMHFFSSSLMHLDCP